MDNLDSSGAGRSGITDSAPRILVLDSEAPIREAVCRFLSRYGYQSLEASSVDEAVSVVEHSRVVAILLDIRPPDRTHGDGLRLLTELRREPITATTPAIIMTGWVLSDRQQQTIAQQQAYLFYKPEGLSALIGFLKQISLVYPTLEPAR